LALYQTLNPTLYNHPTSPVYIAVKVKF